MILTFTSHHAFLPHSSSSTHSLFTANRICNNNNNLSFCTIPLRSLNTTLKPPTPPHRFTSFTTHADSFRRRSEAPLAGDSDFDAFLSLLELSCLLSSAIVSTGVAVIAAWKKELLAVIGTRASVWGVLMLAVGVLTGALIRRRQWRETVAGGFAGSEVNLIQRIDKLEEDLRSSANVVRVLSRQLEKLGIRFRVTRQALKEPIAETAALAQKNSEAARALAVQSDILEKELGEIQHVLLAMQEQQQKQLDLILAIGKAGKLWESKRETSEEHNTLELSNSASDGVKQEVRQI